jgi:sugar O-acyltransferase (sialic acid O-acetyltransferase NeuD family)
MRNGKRRIAVWGAGGHGQVTVDALLACDCWQVVGVLDDDSAKAGRKVLGVTVFDPAGDFSQLIKKLHVDAIGIGIGDNYARDKKFRYVRGRGLEVVNVIHPSAHMSRFVKLGEGITILAGATINPGTVIEDNVCVNTAASVDHDNHLEKNCHILPNSTLTGTVCIGQFASIGSGAVVAPNLAIGKHSYVAAGAVVVKNVPEGVIVAGVPAIEIGQQPKRPEW